MPGGEGVVRAFARLAESRKPALEPDVLEVVAAAGDELVGVHLVRGVPDQAVFGAVEHAVQGQRQLDDAQVGGEVSAPLADDGDDGLSGLLGDLGNLVAGQGFQVRGLVDPVQYPAFHRTLQRRRNRGI